MFFLKYEMSERMTVSSEQMPAQADATKTLTIALAGNPNVGKTTLFNAMTGLKQKVANYPGVTVERKEGHCVLPMADDGRHKDATVIDLPGTYSLASRSPDEHVARRVLLGQISGVPRPDVIIVVCDASNLERNLYLVTQVLELGRPTVVALSMVDLAQKAGAPVDAAKLQAQLKVPVIPVHAQKKLGIRELKKAVANIAGTSPAALELPLPERLETHVHQLEKILNEEKMVHPDQAHFDAHIMLSMGHDDAADEPDPRRDHPRIKTALHEAMTDLTAADIDPISSEIEAHYNYIGKVVAQCVTQTDIRQQPSFSDKLDRILTHKILGLASFVAVMGLVFWSIFSWASPIMDFLADDLVGGFGTFVSEHMSDGPLKDLIVQGVIAGVGNVVVFLPQIAILFFFLSVLEDSGYMSRAAFLMDRLMSKVGLHGKSFIPLLSGYACAIPAIMGTRVIENKRDRLATILVLPLMSCSARLPVYAIVISAFFGAYAGWQQGLILLSMYVLGTVTAFGMAFLFKRTLLKGPTPAFILEMPPYRMPSAKVVLTTVARRCWDYLKRAGTVIFAMSVIMWAATSYPKPASYTKDYDKEIAVKQEKLDALPKVEEKAEEKPATPAADNTQIAKADDKVAGEEVKEAPKTPQEILQEEIDDLNNEKAAENLEYSVAGRVGRAIAPIFAPLGFDWKLSVGVTGAFFAREIVVSTMGIIYSVGEADETSSALMDKMASDYSPLVGIVLMIFVLYCSQCLPTLAVVKRETQSWFYPLFMFAYMTGLAWLAGTLVYQAGRAMGF